MPSRSQSLSVWWLAGTLAVSAAAYAAGDPGQAGPVAITGSVRSRVENWHWFRGTAGDPTYTFNGTALRLNFFQKRPGWEWNFEVEAPMLLHLPTNAFGLGAEGQLGMGATYAAANHVRRYTAMAFPKQAWVRLPGIFGVTGGSLRIGRVEFIDGAELATPNASLAVVKRDRVEQRLVGPFAFTHVMRSFDGLHYSLTRGATNLTALAVTPTRGVFQVDGWGWLKIGLGLASVSRQVEHGRHQAHARLFGIYYRDWREIAKSDNRPAAARARDLAGVAVNTAGGHYLHSYTHPGAGAFDFLAEGAAQWGRWGALAHRARMAALEAGWQPPGLSKLRPWVRGGYYSGSGDLNRGDARHGTFFQILPTARPYARTPFFNMENNVDRFGMLTLRPHPKLTFKTEAHSLRLANANDDWYLGGGAFQPWTFGYQLRPSNGRRSLANLFDANVDIAVSKRLTITPYAGWIQGKAVVAAIYPRGRNGHLFFLESTLRF